MNNKKYYQIPRKYRNTVYPKIEGVDIQSDVEETYDELNNTIDESIGVTLQQIFEYDSDNYATGIHRTCHDKKSIFEKGLIYGDYPDFDDHVQIFPDFVTMLDEIKNCENYKGSTGCFIVKIPKKDIIGKSANETSEPIYYKNEDGDICLRPEFIAGYVSVMNKKMMSFEFNKYKHDNIYDRNTEYFLDENIKNEDIIKRSF